MESVMQQQTPQHRETLRTWLSGLAVSLTAIVAYFAFWRLSPGITFAVGCFSLAALIALAWYYGRETRLDRELGKSPPPPTDRGV